MDLWADKNKYNVRKLEWKLLWDNMTELDEHLWYCLFCRYYNLFIVQKQNFYRSLRRYIKGVWRKSNEEKKKTRLWARRRLVVWSEKRESSSNDQNKLKRSIIPWAPTKRRAKRGSAMTITRILTQRKRRAPRVKGRQPMRKSWERSKTKGIIDQEIMFRRERCSTRIWYSCWLVCVCVCCES